MQGRREGHLVRGKKDKMKGYHKWNALQGTALPTFYLTVFLADFSVLLVPALCGKWGWVENEQLGGYQTAWTEK